MADTDSNQTEVSENRRVVDRRRFIELCGKYAVVTPPAIGLLVAATEAAAHCTNQSQSPHGQPGCSTH